MKNVLIGYTGFVGGYLKSQYDFDLLINRQNLESLANLNTERIICAGLPAAKWLANKDPEGDYVNMMSLCEALLKARTKKFILISTIDVYAEQHGKNEDYNCSQDKNHAYGTNRLKFEEFVKSNFNSHNIIRLPALFGPGLKKNALYDLIKDNNIDVINPNSSFQWYPLNRLKNDIKITEDNNLSLVNLFTEPVETRSIIERLFKGKQVGTNPSPEAYYDLYAKYAQLFGGTGNYIMSKEKVLDEMENFVR